MEYSSDSNRIKVGERIGNALRALYPVSAAKNVARDAQASQRAAEKWLDGTATPSLPHFALLMAKHPSLLLVLAPEVSWVPVATAAVEEATMQAALSASQTKRRQAINAMRGLR